MPWGDKMSIEDQTPVSKQEEVKPSDESSQKKEEYVAKKAYEEVTSDMHKFKSKAKAEQARVNELEAKLKAIEEAKLVEDQKFQELYEREKQAREQAEQDRNKEKDLYIRTVKLSALKGELGGNVKDEYLQFANVDRIEVGEDGTLSSESVRDVANSFRQDHPTLVGKSNDVNITSHAAAADVNHAQPEKTLDTMSTQEKIALLRSMGQSKN